jgi:hypothetical protein
MGLKLTKEELVIRVERLLSGAWDDAEMEHLFSEIAESVPCPFPEIQGHIFHTEGLTPEEIVERMLSYRPIQL